MTCTQIHIAATINMVHITESPINKTRRPLAWSKSDMQKKPLQRVQYASCHFLVRMQNCNKYTSYSRKYKNSGIFSHFLKTDTTFIFYFRSSHINLEIIYLCQYLNCCDRTKTSLLKSDCRRFDNGRGKYIHRGTALPDKISLTTNEKQ